MAKLTKQETKRHNQAVEILSKDVLTLDDKEFVFKNWHEGANHNNGMRGAFFTPYDLAFDFALHVSPPGRVIDLCAGIGMLSFAIRERYRYSEFEFDMVCVEQNYDYYQIGKKLVPEAHWIHGDALDVPDLGLGRFDYCVSNPPFGNIKRMRDSNWTGKDFEYHIIDTASQIADYGVFILPQMSAGFNYSGRPYFERQTTGRAVKFQEKTGLIFECGIGVDTSIFKDEWKGTSPIVEIVSVDFV